MSNIVKVKHFIHVEGSGVKESAIEEFEDFVNSGKVNPIEIDHTYQHLPTPCLSIFVVYADVEQVEKNAKAAAEEVEKKELAKQKPKKKVAKKKGKEQ